MNKIDELIQKVNEEKETAEREERNQVNRLYGLGMEAIEKALKEGLGERWIEELVGDKDWNEMAKGEMTNCSRGHDRSLLVGVKLWVDASWFHLNKLWFRVEVRGFSDGSWRVEGKDVIGGVFNRDSSLKVPEQLDCILVQARHDWKLVRVNDYESKLERPSVYWEAALKGKTLSEAVDYLYSEGARLFTGLYELAPEKEERWGTLLKVWDGWIGEARKKERERLEWEARKPGLLAEYEAAYGKWVRCWKEALELKRRVWMDLQEAVDEPYKVWQLTFCGLCQTEDGTEPRGVFERIWALAPEADGEGYWLVIDRKEGIVRRRIYNLVAIDEGKVVRPTEGDYGTAQSVWSEEFMESLYYPPGMEDEVKGLLVEVEDEVREMMLGLPQKPEEPVGDWGWYELDKVRERVESNE